jgi:hypothetical protein
MRSVVWGGVLGAGFMLVLWGLATWQPALGQRPGAGLGAPANAPGQFGPSGELIALSFDAGGGRQHITLIDPRTAMMSVYGIDPASGEIALRSVRNVRWDLQMDEYNGTTPSPREIRSLLGNK